MKKIVFYLLMALSLSGCLHSKNESQPASGSVTVKGEVKNDAVVWRNYLPVFFKSAFAATFISTRSTLNDITDPVRYSDISKSLGITVSADVINASTVAISGYKVDIAVEDEQFLTQETWVCNVCYSILNGSGTECESLYKVKGNRLFETNPDPLLPTCDVNAGTPALCVTQFNNNPDCSSPTYQVDYQAPGDGLWKATMSSITVSALSNLVNTVGFQSGGWLTGTDKYARFTVYNQNSVFVFQKDYVFNVVN